MIGAIAMSEPAAGSDLQGVRTRAVRDGDSYLIDGSKTFITNGYLADLIVVVAKTDVAAGARGISLLLVETRNVGLSRRPHPRQGWPEGPGHLRALLRQRARPASAVLDGSRGKGFRS
jgi:acyl-CoA dehydrogenase